MHLAARLCRIALAAVAQLANEFVAGRTHRTSASCL